MSVLSVCTPGGLEQPSEHPSACTRGIFTGEAVRHLVNCSTEAAFDEHISDLRQALRSRGYPEILMPYVRYDALKRSELLSKYAARGRSSDVRPPTQNVLAFKVRYCGALPRLRLKTRVDRLLCSLRAELGPDFLPQTRIVLSCMTQRNQFLSHYSKNFLPPFILRQILSGGERG